uniref:Dickkopf protein n=1 Tax=Clytia hemisphaerica TaxID=252671 RepID=A0A069DMD9_9CNID
MKLFIIAVALFAVVASEVQQDFFCSRDSDCDENACCTKVGICSDYVEEGGLCTIRSKLACGCRPGLDCVRSSFITKRCVDNNPGSGGF